MTGRAEVLGRWVAPRLRVRPDGRGACAYATWESRRGRFHGSALDVWSDLQSAHSCFCLSDNTPSILSKREYNEKKNNFILYVMPLFSITMQEPVVIHISMPKDHVEYVLSRIPSFSGNMYSMLGISECSALKQRFSGTPWSECTRLSQSTVSFMGARDRSG